MRSIMRVLFALFILRNCHSPPRRFCKRRIWGESLDRVWSILNTFKPVSKPAPKVQTRLVPSRLAQRFTFCVAPRFKANDRFASSAWAACRVSFGKLTVNVDSVDNSQRPRPRKPLPQATSIVRYASRCRKPRDLPQIPSRQLLRAFQRPLLAQQQTAAATCIDGRLQLRLLPTPTS
jgi:hypothetical protein